MTKRDKISDSGDEFKFEDQKEKALAEKYFKQPKPLPTWQVWDLIQIYRAIKKGSKFEELEEDLQKAIKEADPLFLEAIKEECPNLEIPTKIQQTNEINSYSEDRLYNSIADKITKEHLKSFTELPPDLQWNVENNITEDILYRLEKDFPFFEWPADILYRKVDNYLEIPSKTANAYISERSKGTPSYFVKWNLKTGGLNDYRAKVIETNAKDGKKYHWQLLDSSKELTGPNRFEFEIFKDPITEEYYVLDKETKRIFEIEDYIRKKGGQQNSAAFLKMMQPPYVEPVPVPPRLEVYFDPKSRKHLLPRDLYWKTDIEKELISWFQYDPQLIDANTVNEEIKIIWQALSPEQRLDFLADFSFPLFNIINETANLEDGKIYILSYGTTGSGKTFIHRLAMRFFWGLNSNEYLKGEWIDSKFRLEVILSATNLPIFIDEVSKMSESIIQDIKASTGGGVSGRGQGNLDMRIYHSRTTLVMSAQHNVFADFNITDESALTRRFFVNYYSDKVKRNIKAKYTLDNLKTRGYAIYILQNTTLDELVNLYQQIAEGVEDRILATLIWGAKILNLTPEQLKETRLNIAEDERESLIHLTYNDWEKIGEAKDNPMKRLDPITSQLFGNIIKIEDSKKGIQYLAINTTYLRIVNSTNHPLKGKFKTLSELNELEKYFAKKVIAKLPKGRIFANYPIRFGNGKRFKAACIPYTYEERERAKAVNFAKTLSETYKKLFFPQVQDQQQPQPQAEEPEPQQPQQQEQQQSQKQNNQQPQEPPQQQEQQQKQDIQQPQKPQEQDTQEFIEREKEKERKREQLIDDFKNSNNELELGNHFELVEDEDKRQILEVMYRNGEIMPIPGTGRWKYRLGG